MSTVDPVEPEAVEPEAKAPLTSHEAALQAAVWLEQHVGERVRHAAWFYDHAKGPVYVRAGRLIGVQPPFRLPGELELWAFVVHYEPPQDYENLGGRHPASHVMAVAAVEVEDGRIQVRSPRFTESIALEAWNPEVDDGSECRRELAS